MYQLISRHNQLFLPFLLVKYSSEKGAATTNHLSIFLFEKALIFYLKKVFEVQSQDMDFERFFFTPLIPTAIKS